MKPMIRLLSLMLLALSLTCCAYGHLGDTPSIYDFPAYANADQVLGKVKRCDYVVLENGDVSCGQALWREFYEAAMAGQPATVKLAAYFGGEGDSSVITLAELVFDGEKYRYTERDGETETYLYLFSYDVTVPTYTPETSTFVTPEGYTGIQAMVKLPYTAVTLYTLTDEPALTYEQAMTTPYVLSVPDSFVPHRNVYCDYVY